MFIHSTALSTAAMSSVASLMPGNHDVHKTSWPHLKWRARPRCMSHVPLSAVLKQPSVWPPLLVDAADFALARSDSPIRLKR